MEAHQVSIPNAREETTKTVLLIEDEDAVRIMTSKALYRFGFRVLCASDGEEGLQTYQGRMEEIDAALDKLGEE